MLPQINNKDFMDCDFYDFQILVNNPDYRENQFLDYKKDFAFLKAHPEAKADKISEFRNDICSFANAEGGYIIFGISDDQGMAKELVGVSIENPDRFELDIRNILVPIMPKIPSVKIHFLMLENGRYLVVLFVEHDFYSPYIHVENQKDYKIYKREGNQKIIIGYTELKNMFIQSRVLENEIHEFREKRIDCIRGTGDDKRFMLFHMIPEFFLSDRKELFIIEKRRHVNFGAVFAGAGVDSFSFPCVDGLRYIDRNGNKEAILYNNGIAEFLLPLSNYVNQIKEEYYFFSSDVWNCIERILMGYQSTILPIYGNQRYFGCVSIVGCKGVASEAYGFGQYAKIDRDVIICEPVAFINICEEESFALSMYKIHLEFLLSLGIRRDEEVAKLVNTITQGIEEV